MDFLQNAKFQQFSAKTIFCKGRSRKYPLYTLYIPFIYQVYTRYITYLPRKAVAEVSKDKKPIGRECAEFNWFESQLMSDSNELRVK